MKPISAHVSETDYQELKSLAARSGRSVADLLREAMAEYLVRERRTGHSIRDLPPHRSGRLLAGWTRSELMDEMGER
jgi:hypothetical protein